MELPQHILKGLKELGDQKQFSDAAFKELAETAFRVAINRGTEEKLTASPNLAKLDPILVKETYGSLVSFILEAGKLNSDPAELKDILDEQEVPPNRTELITKMYADTKAAIRNILISTVDVDWRLDYFIRSSNMEKVNTPVYLISLKTKKTRELSTESSENGKNNDKIDFTCTQEQLQDLLFKLKDAVKQAERSSNINM